MRYVLVAIAILVIQFGVLFTHETDIKNQLLKQGRTYFFFANDIRVDNPRVVEYIEKSLK